MRQLRPASPLKRAQFALVEKRRSLLGRSVKVACSAVVRTDALLIDTFNLRRHVGYKANTVARAFAAQQPYFLIGL